MQPAIPATFVIERSFSATPERVFAAFADPAKKRRWFAEADHHQLEVYELDFRVGGKELFRCLFKPGTPVSGLTCTNQTAYLNIVPNQRLVFNSAMSIEDNCISASLCTIELAPSGKGTDLTCTFQGVFFEGADGPEIRQAGWNGLFEKLASELAV